MGICIRKQLCWDRGSNPLDCFVMSSVNGPAEWSNDYEVELIIKRYYSSTLSLLKSSV